MFQLVINNLEAVVKTGTQIKFTRENPFFSEAGDYTLDVTLPLAGCPQNQLIFGAAHRPEMSRKTLLRRPYTFSLLADGLSLSGRAAVTAVSLEEIKVQLLAGKSALNFDSLLENGEEKYIDELELGTAYDTLWAKHCPGETQTALGTMRLLCSSRFSGIETENLLHGTSEHTDCVCFPVWSLADEAWANPHEYCYWGEDVYLGGNERKWRMDGVTYRWPLQKTTVTGSQTVDVGHDLPNTEGEKGGKFDENAVFAPQPYLCFVAERVLSALGYELHPDDNCLRNSWMGSIFVANARGTLHIAGTLPHWTVKTFFDNLRKALNVVVVVEGKRVRIVSRSTAYADRANIVQLQSVTDEQDTDLDEEGESLDTTAGNVGYNFTDSCPLIMNLGEDIYGKMEVRRVTGENIVADFQRLTEEERERSNILYIADGGAVRYGIFKSPNDATGRFLLKEVDFMGPLWREEDCKVDTLLDIVPCMMEEVSPVSRVRMDWGTRILCYTAKSIYPVHPEKQELEGDQYGGFHVPYLVTADTRAAKSLGLYSLQMAIEQGEDTSEEQNPKQEVMEVALNLRTHYRSTYKPFPVYQPAYSENVELPYPIGNPFRESRLGTGVYKDFTSNHFILRDVGSAIRKQLDGGNLDIDTRCVTQFQYLDGLLTPETAVLYRGRRYVCQKIEITIDEHGIQPLKRGYFYEMS